MRQKLYQAIDMAIAAGVPVNMVADVLSSVGWPRNLTNQALDEWLARNNSRITKTDFKTWLKKYQRRAIPAIIVVVAVGLVQAAFMLMRPWPIKIMADSALGTVPAPGPLEPYTHTTTLIAIVSILMFLIYLFGAIAAWLSDILLLRIGFWLNRSIKIESFRHILHLPLFHQARLAKGDYVYRQNVVTNSLSDLVLGTTASIIGSAIMILGILAIMVVISPWMTLVSVVLMPMLYLTLKFIGPRMGLYARRLNEINSATASAINEAVDNAETVQAFTLEEKLIMRVDELWHVGYRLTRLNMMWGNLLKHANSLLVIAATAIIMYFGGLAAINSQITFGELFIFMIYMGYLLSPVENLVQRITSRYQKKIDVGRVYEVLSDHEGIESLRNNRPVPANIQGVVEFQDVSYSYGGATVFENLSLRIEKGEKVGIIGPSGGGKSTLLKLVPLFIEPDSGTILIDGVDTQSVSLRGLRENIAWVSQSPQLFTSSILENIYDGDVYRKVGLDEVKNAVEVANVLEFTTKLPMGINSPAGEDGGSLSGGQRQRVAIARALIRQAPILCLDEPTAALDAKSENYIRDSLMQMVRSKTVIMVTHRKSLLALMDTIYVLDGGKLTNVNALGGLDRYLAQLEGIVEQQVVRDIENDKWYTAANKFEDNIGLKSAATPVAREVKPIDTVEVSTKEQSPAVPEGERGQIYTIDHPDISEYYGVTSRQDGSWDNADNTEEVIIHLRDNE